MIKKNNSLIAAALLLVAAHVHGAACDRRAIAGAVVAGGAAVEVVHALWNKYQTPTAKQDVAYLYGRLPKEEKARLEQALIAAAPHTPKSLSAAARLKTPAKQVPAARPEEQKGASSSASSSSSSSSNSRPVDVPLGRAVTIAADASTTAVDLGTSVLGS